GPTHARSSAALQEGKDTQRERKGGENLGVRGECVTRPAVGMDEHGVANATPCPRPIVPHLRANPPYDQGGGCDDKDGEDMNGKKIVLPSHFEHGDENVIASLCVRFPCV